ncbi:MAG: hypothetical protein GY861_14970 [bacterium]|nr:hypothetical protein [bacterium]
MSEEIDKWVLHAKKRISNGENIDNVMHDFSAKGVSQADIEQIVMKIVLSDKAKIKEIKNHIALIKPALGISVFLLVILIIWFLISSMNFAALGVWEDFNESKITYPIQAKYRATEPFVQEVDGKSFEIIPVASYEVTALVAGRRNYNDDLSISPMDLALIWGDLATRNYEDYVKISQPNRKWSFRISSSASSKIDLVSEHGANTHIIPANEKVLEGLKTINKNQMVYLKGYLSNVKGPNRFWSTSLTREDKYSGSCEILYVEKLIIADEIYQ